MTRTIKQDLKRYTNLATARGAFLGLITLLPFLNLPLMILLSVVYAFVFRFVFKMLYEHLMYSSLAFYEFSRKLEFKRGFPHIWRPLLLKSRRRSYRLVCLLLTLLLFPIFLLAKQGIPPIVPGLVLLLVGGQTYRLLRIQENQRILVLERAEAFETKYSSVSTSNQSIKNEREDPHL